MTEALAEIVFIFMSAVTVCACLVVFFYTLFRILDIAKAIGGKDGGDS
jgi:hypothetical protein